jgi:hypothetical protein
VFESIFEIQKQLSPDNDDFFFSRAIQKICETYRPITYRLLQKNCRLLNLKCDDLLARSWQEETKQELQKALQTYSSHQHYISDRNLHAYLLASLRNFTKQRFWSQSGKQKYCVLICPACRLENQKNILVQENQLWRCIFCTEKSKSISLAQKSFHSTFALHSRIGFLCPECQNFIPRSVEKNGLLICPYPNCCFSGSTKSLLRTTHPVMIRFRDKTLSIEIGNTVKNKNESRNDFFLKDPNSSLSEDSFLLKDISQKEFQLLKDAIQSSMSFTERQNLPATKVQKTLFYRAFWDVTQEHPEEMISYLVHNKTNFDFSLQATIFQKFLKHLEDFLPYSFVTSNRKQEIFSLFDSQLGLFDDESSFQAIVQKDFSLPNLTSEHYLSENLKDYGQYFLGKIMELKDENGNNLLSEMKSYSFVKIQFSENIPPGTKVFVRHYRLIPHYTMGILIHLQKIRKHLGEVLARKKKNWR